MKKVTLKEGIQDYLDRTAPSRKPINRQHLAFAANMIYEFLDRGGIVDENNIMLTIAQIPNSINEAPRLIYLLKKGIKETNMLNSIWATQSLTPEFCKGATTAIDAIIDYATKIKEDLKVAHHID